MWRSIWYSLGIYFVFCSRVGFLGRRIEWRCFRFDQIQDDGHDITWHNSSTRAERCRLLPNYFGPCYCWYYFCIMTISSYSDRKTTVTGITGKFLIKCLNKNNIGKLRKCNVYYGHWVGGATACCMRLACTQKVLFQLFTKLNETHLMGLLLHDVTEWDEVLWRSDIILADIRPEPYVTV